MILILSLSFLTCLNYAAETKSKTNALQLTVQLSNTVYSLDEPILAKITYKNVSSYEIKFYKEFTNFPSPRMLFDLQRIQIPGDRGDEITLSPKSDTLVTLSNIPSYWKILKPDEEYTATIDLNNLVKHWEVKPGTHQLILIHKTYIFKNDSGKFEYVLNSEGKDRWPSKPFTLTLEAPKSPTSESSK